MKKEKNSKRYIIASVIISVILLIIALLIDRYVNTENKSIFFFFLILHDMFKLTFIPSKLGTVARVIIGFIIPLISYILMCVAYGENSKKAICRWALIPTNWPAVIGIFGMFVFLFFILSVGISKNRPNIY